MAEEYRLIFRGEVLEGQHPAVVKKRLAGTLKLDDARAEALFTGKPVVIRKAVDRATAARFQAAFKQSGARLRVAALDPSTETPAEPAAPVPANSDAGAAQSAPADELSILPPGSDLLTEAERPKVTVQEVETDHLSLSGASFVVSEPENAEEEQLAAPDVSHLSLDDLGAILGETKEQPELLELDVDFDLAAVGADLGEASEEVPVVVPEADFEVAPPGERLGPAEADQAPPAPDTSHIQLEEPDPS